MKKIAKLLGFLGFFGAALGGVLLSDAHAATPCSAGYYGMGQGTIEDCTACPSPYTNSTSGYNRYEAMCYESCGTTCEDVSHKYGTTTTYGLPPGYAVNTSLGTSTQVLFQSLNGLVSCSNLDGMCPLIVTCDSSSSSDACKISWKSVEFLDLNGEVIGKPLYIAFGHFWSSQKVQGGYDTGTGTSISYSAFYPVFDTPTAPAVANRPFLGYSRTYDPNGTMTIPAESSYNHGKLTSANAFATVDGVSGDTVTLRAVYACEPGYEWNNGNCEPMSYKVVYNCNDATQHTIQDSITPVFGGLYTVQGHTVDISVCTPPVQGTQIVKWQIINDNGGTDEYAPGDQITWGYTVNTTFTAVWGQTTYNITYHPNGGTAGSGNHPATYDTTDLPLSITWVPERSHSVFEGWCKRENLTECSAIPYEIPSGTTGDINLYAKWNCDPGYMLSGNSCVESNELPVRYECGDGATGGPATDTATYLGSYTVRDVDYATCSKTGYTFSGWAFSGGGLYYGGNVINSWIYTTEQTFTAKWTANEYRIDYKNMAHSAPVSGMPDSYEYGVGATINGTPSLANGSFEKWCRDANLTDCAMPLTIATNETGDKVLWAKWKCDTGFTLSNDKDSCEANTYTVTYQCGAHGTGTNVTDTATYHANYVVQNSNVNITCTPDSGYEFTGWKFSGDNRDYVQNDEIYWEYANNSETLTAQYSQCGGGYYYDNGSCVQCPEGFQSSPTAVSSIDLCYGPDTCDCTEVQSDCPTEHVESCTIDTTATYSGIHYYGSQNVCLPESGDPMHCPFEFVCEPMYHHNATNTACISCEEGEYWNSGECDRCEQLGDGWTSRDPFNWSINQCYRVCTNGASCDSGLPSDSLASGVQTELFAPDVAGRQIEFYGNAQAGIDTCDATDFPYCARVVNLNTPVAYKPIAHSVTFNKTTSAPLRTLWTIGRHNPDPSSTTLYGDMWSAIVGPGQQTSTSAIGYAYTPIYYPIGLAPDAGEVTGQTFMGYYYPQSGETQQYVNASRALTATNAQDVTNGLSDPRDLYAAWENNTYTVTYSCGELASGTPPANGTATYNSGFTPAANTCIYTGHTFLGWAVSGTNDIRQPEVEFTWTYTENKTFTAKWSGMNSYNISYENMTNATPAATGMPTSYTYGTGATIDGVPTRANSEFAGWCTDETLENCAMTQTIGTTATGDKTFWANWECLPPYHSNANGTACVACENGYYWNGTDCSTACPPEYPYSRSPYNWSIDQCYNYCDTATCESYNVSGFPNGYTAEPIDSSSKQITFYGNARNGINACDGTVKYCAYGFASTPGALPSTLYKPMTVPVDFYGHMPQENLGTLYIFGSRAGGSSIDINTGDVWSQIVGPGQQTPVINNTQTGLTYQYTPIFYPADMAPNADVTGYTFDGYYYPENGSTQYVGSDYVLNATNALAVINSGQTGGYNIPRKLYATMNHGYSLGCYKVSFNNSWHGGTPTTSTLSFYKKGTSWYAGTDSNCTGTPIANPSVANELPTKTNATFTGYYDESGPDLMIFDANGAATMYANIWTITSDTTLYAQYTCDANAHQTSNDACVVCTAPTACWDNNTEQCVACAVVDHTITLDKNVGGLQGDDSSPSILYTVEGQGVYTDLATENPFTALTAVPTKYAIVTFNHCDGTNGACDSTANTETKNSDFPFVGFYDATSAINVISNNGNLTNDGYTNAIGLHGDATWYAHWGIHGMIANWPQNPTRSGYNFVAWKDEPNCTGNTMTSTSYIDTDTTLYACWTMNTSYECQVYCDVALSTCPYQNASCEYDETQYQSGHNNGVSGAPCLDNDGHEIVAVACPISNVSCTQAGYIWVSTDEQCEQCTCTLGTGVDTCTPSSVGNQCTATGSCATGYVNFTPNCSGTTCEPYCGANTFTVNYECGTHGAAASGYDMYNTATYGAGYKVAHQSYTSSNVIALCNPNTGYVLANPTWKLEGTSYTGNTGDVIGSWQYSMSAPTFIAQYDCDTANFWFHNSSSDTCVLCNGANEYWNSTTESCGQCGAGTYPNAAHDACINEGQYEITLNKNVNSGAVHGIDGQTTLYTVHNTGVYRDAARTTEMTTAGNPLTEGNLPKKYAIVTFNHCDVDNDILCTNPANTEDVVNAYFAFNGFYQDTTTGSKYINEYGYITDGANGGMTVGAGYTDNNHVWYAHWAAQGILNGFPANPTRAGYTFVEWRTLPNGMGTVVPNNQTYTVTADTTLYANWAANAYDIHYVLNGGENYHGAPTSYSYGTGAQINGTPTRDNSQFIGWCDDAALTQNCDKVRVISGTETGDKTFYAKWACDCGYSATQNGQGCVANTITVNYQSEYGTVPASGTCTYNDVNGFTLASAIDAQGHDFSGWAMNYQRFNAGQTVACNYTTFGVCNGSVNANAIWGEANTYRIDYIMNGGVNYDGAPTSYMYGIGAQINGTPTRDNSQFVAWCDDANLKVNCARNKIIDSNDSGNKVFYAKWSCDCGYAPTSNAEACDANTIILNYNNGGHGNAQLPAAYCTYGNNFQLYNAISATGYEFSGWSVNNDTISAGATVACDNQTLGVCDGSVVISATWGTNTITLDWDENHGTEIPNGSCQYGDTLALASELPNRTGYTFSGWELVNSIVKAAGTTVSSGCTETYTGVTSGTSHGIRAVWCHNCIQPAVQNVCSLNTEGPGDCVYTYTECPQGYTLYIPQEAPWNPSCVQNQYTITYSANGGTGADQTQNVFFGSTFVTRPRSIFTNSGYMLTKWRIADATATYDPDTSYTYDINGNTTLEATWERCTCSYAGNSGVQACDPYSTANSTCGGTATCLAHFVNPTVTCANDGPACTATCTECGAGYISVNDNCDPCDPGHYQSGNECPQCSGNTIAPNPGATSCVECPEYTLANAEHTQCLYCPTGSILVNGVCEQCTAGHYQSGNDCLICLGNTIAPNPGAASCTECPEYTLANAEHTQCLYCPTGSILVNGTCESCAAGHYQSGNDCPTCPGNTIAANPGATSCTECPEYTVANQDHTACVSCPAGSVSVNGACEQCTAGHYQSGNDCPICPGNTIAANPGATSCTECPEYTVANQDHTACVSCPAGSVSVNGACEQCTAGHYQSGNDCPICPGNTIAANPGATSCTECPEYTLANAEHTQCLYCPTGSILVNGVCEQCTAGHYQSGNDCPICPGNTIAPNPGAASCTECPEYTVANQDHTACASCPAGSILVNGVCEQCAAGTYQSGNSCVQCPAGKTSYAGATSINDCFIDPGTCAPDEHVEQGECVSNTKECTVPHATSAKREWNASIGTYGPCVVETCDEANGYRVSGNACVKDSCVVEHGSAETEWNVADNRWECIVTKCDPGYERSADDKSCVECYNRRVDGEIAVSSYVSECEIAACMYQGQKYTLDGNECRLICEEKTDETGSMIWDNIRKQCVRTCNKGYKMW